MAPVDNILLDLEIYLERQVRMDTKVIWLMRVVLDHELDHIKEVVVAHGDKLAAGCWHVGLVW